MKKLKIVGTVLTVLGGAITIASAFVHSKLEENMIDEKVKKALSKLVGG